MIKNLLAILTAALPMLLAADVVMQLEMPRSSYMQYEPVVANLTLRNTSGQVLVFGAEAEFKGHMEIELTDMHDRPVSGSGAKVDLRGMILRSGADQRIRINLSKWINLTRVGFYRIKVFIAHPMLKNEYESNRCMFDISQGTVFWSRTFGVPQLEKVNVNQKLQLRTYNLRALQDKADVHLYLFVEDDDKIYAIKYIGMVLGREHAKCEIDTLNRLHILLPLTPKIFRYQVYDWNGQLETNKLYRTAERIPVLFRDAGNGDVKVIGGEAIAPSTNNPGERLLPDMPLPEVSAAEPVLPPAPPQPAAGSKKMQSLPVRAK